MRDRYGNGGWQDRKERLMKAYFDLEANPLWQEIMEDCLLRANDADSAAAGAPSDRAASILHGEARGLRSMLSRPLEMREARMAHYSSEQLKEEYEFGKDTDASGYGGQADSAAGSRPAKIERRRFFAEVQDAETDPD